MTHLFVLSNTIPPDSALHVRSPSSSHDLWAAAQISNAGVYQFAVLFTKFGFLYYRLMKKSAQKTWNETSILLLLPAAFNDISLFFFF